MSRITAATATMIHRVSVVTGPPCHAKQQAGREHPGNHHDRCQIHRIAPARAIVRI
jgi:hypothetical protein